MYIPAQMTSRGKGKRLLVLTARSASNPPAIAAIEATMAAAEKFQGVNAIPMATGNIDWNTIAPVMLPRAKASLPECIQIKLLAFSGFTGEGGDEQREYER